MVPGNRDRMPEYEGVGTDLDFLQDEPDDPLAIGKRQGLGGLVELGEKAFKALGQRHVCLGVHQFRLEGGQLRLGRRFPLSQRRHALAQLLQREKLFLVRLDEPRDRSTDSAHRLDHALAFHVMGCSVRTAASRRSISWRTSDGFSNKRMTSSQTSASNASCRTGRFVQRRPSGYR